jgi:hypothetical protein
VHFCPALQEEGCGAWQMDTLPGFEKSDRDPISRAVVLKSLNSSRPLFRVQGFFAESSGRSATQAILVLSLLMLICRVAYHHRIQFLLLPGSPVRVVPSASVSKYCTVTSKVIDHMRGLSNFPTFGNWDDHKSCLTMEHSQQLCNIINLSYISAYKL